MENKEQTIVQSVGFVGLLTLAFIVLKLCGVITWSWWWVLSPLLISTGITIVLVIVLLIMAAVIYRKHKRERNE